VLVPALTQLSSTKGSSGIELLFDCEEPPPHDVMNKKQHAIKNLIFI
jgi:hypothetical protein